MLVCEPLVYRMGAGIPFTVTLVPPNVVASAGPAGGMAAATPGEGPTVWPRMITISPGATQVALEAYPEGHRACWLAALVTDRISAGGAMLPRSPRAVVLPLGWPAA